MAPDPTLGPADGCGNTPDDTEAAPIVQIVRQEQIALIDSAETRTASYLRKWLQVPAFKAALRRRG